MNCLATMHSVADRQTGRQHYDANSRYNRLKMIKNSRDCEAITFFWWARLHVYATTSH